MPDSSPANQKNEIAAIVTTDDSVIKNGNATLFLCKNEEEQKAIMREVALALKADVARLSNGTYLVIK